ncbi:ABC transporter ATP-binding protein [Paenibacillus cremeus]|uniref:ABC transporter ATP-binding protein n=1 Tax=Paenibacillus cremeus TaxID=2163881 RepID=A0A559JKF4_9BACL|nr:ABC transporter ATP-binding protein [Paenibacillus cremeus]TVY00349.1 ABC transporter ATP-binding protein [Paenibacillus cremeus]
MKDPRLLLNYLKAHWYVYLLAVLFIALANVTQSYYPKVLGNFADQLELGAITRPLIVHYSLLLLGIGLTYGLLGGLGQYIVMHMGRLFEFYTRKRLFEHFATLSEHYYSKHGVGELLSYVMNDVKNVRDSISQGINHMTNSLILILSVIVMLSFSSIPAYLIFICILPMLAIPWVVVSFGPVIKRRSRKVQEALAAMTESAEEQFGGIRVTKTFAVEKIMRGRFGRTVDRILEHQLRLVRVSSLFQALMPFLGSLSLIISIAVGGYLTIHKQITLGNFVSLTLYLRMMVNPLQQIGNVINTMQRSRASLERVNNLLAIKQDIEEAEDAAPLRPGAVGIHMDGLTFTYPESSKPALQGIELVVPPGKTLGIIGKTGSGKTTLVKLLLRIYDTPEHTIRIGDQDLRSITLESLRSSIAYVPQDGFLFSTTIRDNIAFYDRETEFTNVEKAAKQAQIHNNIIEFPEQFETRLGERGITLSGGQRQRTSLARGFIKNAPVLILDDSVSAVDAVTETKIIENIRLGRKGKTTIIIAHRISALKHADEIIVMDEGKIVQRGTHHQLLAEDGIYAALYSIQEEGTRYAEGK